MTGRVCVWRNGKSSIVLDPDGSWWPYKAYREGSIYNTGIYHYRWWAIVRTRMVHRRANRQEATAEKYA